MLNLITEKIKRIVSVLALACFLCSPLGYVATLPTASAASFDSRHDNSSHYRDRDYRHDRDRDDDDDEDYTKGNIVTAVLVGGVIGAIIAKNT